MLPLIITIIIVRIIIMLLPLIQQWKKDLQQAWTALFTRKVNSAIFDSSYLDVQSLYVQRFKTPPCISSVNNIDAAKAFEYISKHQAGKVLTVYQRNYFNWNQNEMVFHKTVFVLEKKVMIELGSEYAEIFFPDNRYGYADKLVEVFTGFKATEREIRHEMNIISLTSSGLELKQLPVNQTDLDIDMYYNDDFKPVDNVIRERLSRENDKGIVLLHGLPGTGKTTYLRHLIGSIKKKILFVSPSVAGNLMNPEFIDLLIDNPNAILIIEDAENIIMDRKYSTYSGVSNLLNISDGLLSDCLNVQIICTFNSALSLVDHALMRKGRLIAKYEFGKLDVVKAQRLSNHLGLINHITKPMSLAEITNPEVIDEPAPISAIGFRRMEQLMEHTS